MPASQARRLCPTAVVIPLDFVAYREKSRDVWKIVRERLEALQSMGLDEAYADLTGVEKPLRVLREVIEAGQERDRHPDQRRRRPIAAGGQVLLGPRQARRVRGDGTRGGLIRFAPAPTRRIPGIGPKTAERLAELGYATVGQLQEADEAQLAARFGDRWARYLKSRATFHDDSPVETESGAAKSVSTERTFDTDIEGHDELETILRRSPRSSAEGLEKKGRKGRTVAIKVRLSDWTTVTRAKTLDGSTNDTTLVTDTALALLRAYAPPQPVRLLGVRLAGFDDIELDRPPAPVAPVGQWRCPSKTTPTRACGATRAPPGARRRAHPRHRRPRGADPRGARPRSRGSR